MRRARRRVRARRGQCALGRTFVRKEPRGTTPFIACSRSTRLSIVAPALSFIAWFGALQPFRPVLFVGLVLLVFVQNFLFTLSVSRDAPSRNLTFLQGEQLRRAAPQVQGEMQADTSLFTFGTPEVILRPRKPTDEDGLHDYPTPGLSVIKDKSSIWAASLVGSPSNALTPTLCGVRRKPFHDVSAECIVLGSSVLRLCLVARPEPN